MNLCPQPLRAPGYALCTTHRGGHLSTCEEGKEKPQISPQCSIQSKGFITFRESKISAYSLASCLIADHLCYLVPATFNYLPAQTHIMLLVTTILLYGFLCLECASQHFLGPEDLLFQTLMFNVAPSVPMPGVAAPQPCTCFSLHWPCQIFLTFPYENQINQHMVINTQTSIQHIMLKKCQPL